MSVLVVLTAGVVGFRVVVGGKYVLWIGCGKSKRMTGFS